ncbi:MAG: hypothetical protein K0S25_442 [Bacillus sp. (in: firmicutes)]|jgi:regulator of replication initiation timing|uniref:hypothetical protein n=1 Tax=Bacillus sp. 1NLA3E TaxID=666686 RepID=UPI000247F4C5|nr:hypothetical protein [Bacillus sp. 1NLA3E]AGK54668.1 hypothetical protein B1NLA3E_14610 [Bacillus sp. 1NLA3E]MDF2902804.1 hypothetical protein [Bacillus sp. (in: firmicutes)]
MKEPMIFRTELLKRLNKIYRQLEELEDVLHSSFIKQQGNILKLEKDRMDHCTGKISALEDEVLSQTIEKRSVKPGTENKGKKLTTSIHLELGFKSL